MNGLFQVRFSSLNEAETVYDVRTVTVFEEEQIQFLMYQDGKWMWMDSSYYRPIEQ